MTDDAHSFAPRRVLERDDYMACSISARIIPPWVSHDTHDFQGSSAYLVEGWYVALWRDEVRSDGASRPVTSEQTAASALIVAACERGEIDPHAMRELWAAMGADAVLQAWRTVHKKIEAL